MYTAFTQAASRTDDHIAHVGRRKFDNHRPRTCLCVRTWHAPSDPMTRNDVGVHSGRCDSHCLVDNSEELAGGVLPLLRRGDSEES